MGNNTYIDKMRGTRYQRMIDLVPTDDIYYKEMIGRVKVCNSCGLLSVIDLICAGCNCAKNQHIFLNPSKDCPKQFWTKLI